MGGEQFHMSMKVLKKSPRLTIEFSLLWLFIMPLTLFAQRSGEPPFENLCRNYVQSPNENTKAKLIHYCETHQRGQFAGLGFFLIGFKEFQNERFGLATSFFERAASYNIPIEDYTHYYWAESLFRIGQPANSQKKLADFLARFPESPFREKALSLFWETSLSINDSQAILDSLKFSPNYLEDPEALFYLGQAQESRGLLIQALQSYQRLYYFFPLYSNNWAVSQKLSKLLQDNPTIKSEIPNEWKVTRVQKLLSDKRYSETLKELELLLESDFSLATKPQFQLWLGVCQFGLGRNLEAIQTLRNWEAADPEISAQAAFYIAESYRKLDNYPSFKESVDNLGNRHSASRWFEEGLFSIGNYNFVRRNLAESTSFYQKLVELFPQGPHVMDSHWRVSWQSYRLRDYKRAYQMFVEHFNRFEGSPYRTAALYWAARCKENLGQLAEAYRIYHAIRQRFGNNYYGLLAAKQTASLEGQIKTNQSIDPQLERIIRTLEASFGNTNKVDLPDLQNSTLEAWPRVNALARIQLFDLAGKELLFRQVYGDSPVIYFQAAQLFYRGKNFEQTVVNLRRVLPNYRDMPFHSLPKAVWEMFFPANFIEVVFKEAKRQKVDPHLVLALIRQESIFNPNALSQANAHGLMQLLPSTARVVAREMRLRRPTPARLYDPGLNIRLGTKYFAGLLKRFGGQEDKALASYNAGVDRVESWMSEGGFADSAEFIETIPFSETRNYVKIIYRDYWFYKTLYTQERG
jgi:soluble lytic murein transglycosylase